MLIYKYYKKWMNNRDNWINLKNEIHWLMLKNIYKILIEIY